MSIGTPGETAEEGLQAICKEKAPVVIHRSLSGETNLTFLRLPGWLYPVSAIIRLTEARGLSTLAIPGKVITGH